MPKSLHGSASISGLVLLLAASAAAHAGDSSSLTPRAGVGYTAPTRAQHAIRADRADTADRATHAETADRVSGEADPGRPEPGPVCGSGADRGCGQTEALKPGHYLVTCKGYRTEGDYGEVFTYSLVVTGGSRYSECPGSRSAGAGIRGHHILRVFRVS